MSRFANLPLAVRLGTAFGLQAVALLLVTVLALAGLRLVPERGPRRCRQRDVRAVSLAGEVGQHVQSIGRLTTEHLYVYDGDLEAQDQLAERDRGDGRRRPGRRRPSSPRSSRTTRTWRASTRRSAIWSKALARPLEALARRDRQRHRGPLRARATSTSGEISPAMDQLFTTMDKLQDSVQASAEATVAGVEADAERARRGCC